MVKLASIRLLQRKSGEVRVPGQRAGGVGGAVGVGCGEDGRDEGGVGRGWGGLSGKDLTTRGRGGGGGCDEEGKEGEKVHF